MWSWRMLDLGCDEMIDFLFIIKFCVGNYLEVLID